MQKVSCGIDFGTSNSAISIVEENVTIIPVEKHHTTIPSALFFENEDKKQLWFGREAQKAYMEGYEGRFMRSLKRVLGTDLMKTNTVVNGRSLSFSDIIATFFKNLKSQISISGYDTDNVVIGRPVHFVDYDSCADNKAQNQLEEIAKKVGFKNIKFQYEPIAAAFAHEQNVTGEKLAIVVDIGGGTSDFTIIRLSKTRKNIANRSNDILANTGIRIGGNDFDKDLSINSIMPHLGYETYYGAKKLTVPKVDFHDMSEWNKINFVYTPQILKSFQDMLKQSNSPEKLSRFINILEHQQGHNLLNLTENAKIALTKQIETTITINCIEESLTIPIKQLDFNRIIKNNIKKITNNIQECLQQAQVTTEMIEIVVLTGGSTDIPYIQSTLSLIFPNAFFSQENKLSSVALGLGYDAQNTF